MRFLCSRRRKKRRDFRIKFKDKQPVNKQIFGNFYRDVIFGGITDEYLFVFFGHMLNLYKIQYAKMFL